MERLIFDYKAFEDAIAHYNKKENEIKEKIKILWSKIPNFVYNEMISLHDTDIFMSARGYERNHSRYIHKDNGHHIRYNKVKSVTFPEHKDYLYLELPRDHSLFKFNSSKLNEIVQVRKEIMELTKVSNSLCMRRKLSRNEMTESKNAIQQVLISKLIKNEFDSHEEYINYCFNEKYDKSYSLVSVYKHDILDVFNKEDIKIDIKEELLDNATLFNLLDVFKKHNKTSLVKAVYVKGISQYLNLNFTPK